MAELHDILETNPDTARAHILLILTQLRENNLDAALEAGQNLKKNLKDNPLPDKGAHDRFRLSANCAFVGPASPE